MAAIAAVDTSVVYQLHRGAKELLHSVYNTFIFLTINESHLWQLSLFNQSNYRPHDGAPLHGASRHREPFMFLNKPFITVIETFFTADGSFVCPKPDRQADKNSYSLRKEKKTPVFVQLGALS